jgi:hypothetical protein
MYILTWKAVFQQIRNTQFNIAKYMDSLIAKWPAKHYYYLKMKRAYPESFGDKNKDNPNPRIILLSNDLLDDILRNDLMLTRRLSTSWLILAFRVS